jgi:hypothetical protein
MPLTWNEIKSRGLAFTNEWKDEVSEDAEAKSFWDNFFNVFGTSRRRVQALSNRFAQFPPLPGRRVEAGYVNLLHDKILYCTSC